MLLLCCECHCFQFDIALLFYLAQQSKMGYDFWFSTLSLSLSLSLSVVCWFFVSFILSSILFVLCCWMCLPHSKSVLYAQQRDIAHDNWFDFIVYTHVIQQIYYCINILLHIWVLWGRVNAFVCHTMCVRVCVVGYNISVVCIMYVFYISYSGLSSCNERWQKRNRNKFIKE